MSMQPQRFRNRTDAGRQLAEKLAAYTNRPGVLVLALPRGGVPVGFEVARALGAPLDVFLVRKLGVPGYEELAMGAVATGGVRVLNDEIVRGLGISEREIDAVVARELRELSRRDRLYRGDRPPSDVAGRTVILVDDGLGDRSHDAGCRTGPETAAARPHRRGGSDRLPRHLSGAEGRGRRRHLRGRRRHLRHYPRA